MDTLIIILITILVTVAAVKLYPYIKDLKVSPEEKAAVQEIIVDTVKDILTVASANKTKEQLVVAITNIVMRRMSEEEITGFTEKDIKLMVDIVIIALCYLDNTFLKLVLLGLISKSLCVIGVLIMDMIIIHIRLKTDMGIWYMLRILS